MTQTHVSPGSEGPVRVALVGTSAIGRIHADAIGRADGIELVAVSGVDPDAPGVADHYGVPLEADYRRLVDHAPDGVVIATPNHLHLEMGAFFADAGVHVLVEKPIAHTVDAALELCRAAESAGVALLVGHHRRHSSTVKGAAAIVAERIGMLVGTNTLVTMKKPDSYFESEWSRSSSGGPLLVNLIHEVDLLRAVCGEVSSVQAVTSRRARGFEYEDSASILLGYADGAAGTLLVSDATPSPWSWEASAGEGFGFHHTGLDYSTFFGTEGVLSFPSLTFWTYAGQADEPGWKTPLESRRFQTENVEPYTEQIAHFARVIRGVEEPRVPGVDATRSLAVVLAVSDAASTGRPVEIDTML